MTSARRLRLAAGALAFGAAMTTGTALAAPAHAATTGGIATAYELTVIKAGPISGAETDVFGINNSGEVFGTGDLAGQQAGFVLPAGGSAATFLGQPSDASPSLSAPFPEMINNNGDLVGSYIANSIDNPTQAVEWPGGTTPTSLEPAIDKAVGFTGSDTVANGINDHGLIVVALTDGSISDGLTVQGGTVTELPGLPGGGGTFGSTNANPIAVNNNGLIVGSAVNKAGNEVAAEWQNGKIKSLGGLPGSMQTEALAVNSAGLAVGASISATDFNEHAVEFVNGKVIDLNVPGETGNDAQAKAVNDSGVIVGGDGNGDAFAFASGHSVNLNTLIPAGSGVTLTLANGINNNGVIVGDATINSTGQNVGFELTPVS
jgi:uncharacterized membrane protein